MEVCCRKLNNCIDAIENGVSRVHILDGRIPHCCFLKSLQIKESELQLKMDIEERYYYGE